MSLIIKPRSEMFPAPKPNPRAHATMHRRANVKLNPRLVQEILYDSIYNHMTQIQIAQKYKISQPQIGRIINRKSWFWVELPPWAFAHHPLKIRPRNR